MRYQRSGSRNRGVEIQNLLFFLDGLIYNEHYSLKGGKRDEKKHG